MSQRGSAGAKTRAVAARVLAQVIGSGRSLSVALPEGLATLDSGKDRSFVQAICFGVLRDFERLQYILDKLLDRRLKRRDAELRCLLLAGIHQIADMKVPDHAAVAATVGAAAVVRRQSAKGLINAVLRRFIREKDALTEAALATAEGRFVHPDWIIRKLREDWPEDWQSILLEGARQPPMWLRVNKSQISREDYLAELQGLEATIGEHAPESICLARAVDVHQLPGFADGLVSVQDAGAQLAAHLVEPLVGQRVLDACAAPGGKTCHMLELCPETEVTALDSSVDRMEKLTENLHRLHLNANLLSADATETDDWWDGKAFDAILLDAPCTATGVIRRHPDIKLLRRPGDVATLAKKQSDLLDALWPLLAPGGKLVYCTCSVFPDEGAGQLRRFVSRNPDSALRPMDVGWGREADPGRQIFPGEAGMDGFYYACLVKPDG